MRISTFSLLDSVLAVFLKSVGISGSCRNSASSVYSFSVVWLNYGTQVKVSAFSLCLDIARFWETFADSLRLASSGGTTNSLSLTLNELQVNKQDSKPCMPVTIQTARRCAFPKMSTMLTLIRNKDGFTPTKRKQ